jgi:hypothetical protein
MKHRLPGDLPTALRLVLASATIAFPAAAIERSPTGVNVNSQGATTVFITFGGLRNQVPSEALWCGELMPASPAIGQTCRPGTIFGRLPIRYDLSKSTSPASFTDIMSIPPNVARRAYDAAAGGATSTFFYVRRFASTVGGPDEFVAVTCRLTGGGARTPLALLDVQLRFDGNNPVTQFAAGQAPPRLFADVVYNGSGRLKGRWEVVLPGDDLPTAQDLLPEGSLPVEQRPFQKRYTQVGTFNEQLPPTGRARIPGPDPARLPAGVEGLYQVLLRVEASDDKEGDSDLAFAGAGQGVVHSGGLAGFPMPVLRYYVGSAPDLATSDAGSGPGHLLPVADARVDGARLVTFTWAAVRQAAFYRFELRDARQAVLLSALLQPGIESYRTPSWLKEKAQAGRLEWRVSALDVEGGAMSDSGWRGLLWGENAAPAVP